MSRAWSKLVSDRFHLRLPADVAAWFDSELWQQPGGAEFHEPLTPEQIVDPPLGTIWASFMLPDTIPIVCNGYGDWLCLRANPAGEVSEVVFWTHDGGDWIPFGKNLAEALIFDAAAAVLYPPKPEFDDPPPPHEQQFRYAEWARTWLQANNKNISAFWENDDHTPPLLQQLITNDVAKTAAQRNLILDHLETKLKSVSSAKVAQQIGIKWEPDYVSWLFDASLLPAIQRSQLSQHFRIPEGEIAQQDWNEAEKLALAVLDERADLGWAHDVAGWAAERRGEIARAISFYREGIHPSLFADNTVKFRTHWFANGYGKFSASRLFALRDHLPRELYADPYVQLFLQNENATLRERICEYWLAEAKKAESAGHHGHAYQCYYKAGWDMGLTDLQEFPKIFDGLVKSANAAGWKSLAAIAELHRSFL